jgi:hypothetical protein
VAEGYISRYLAEYIDQPAESSVISLEPAHEPEPVKRPYGNAAKSEWAAYAISCGADEDEAKAMTKVQLMAEYGERL